MEFSDSVAYIGALACQKLQRYGEVIEWCDEGLRVSASSLSLSLPLPLSLSLSLSLCEGYLHTRPLNPKVDAENTSLKELRAKATKEKVCTE